jgi:hypothetical protein
VFLSQTYLAGSGIAAAVKSTAAKQSEALPEFKHPDFLAPTEAIAACKVKT